MTRLLSPILIVGPGRSGKTSLLNLLAEARGTAPSASELNHIWQIGHAFRKHDRASEADVGFLSRRRIRNKVLELQRAHPGQRLLFHSPFATFKIPFLAAVLPEMRFIFIHMDGRASIGMQLARHRHGNNHYVLSHAGTRRHLLGRVRQTSWWEWPAYVPRVTRGVWLRYVRRRPLRMRGPQYPGWLEDERHLSTAQLYARQWSMGVVCAREGLSRLPGQRWCEVSYHALAREPRLELERVVRCCELDMPGEGMGRAERWFEGVDVDQWVHLLAGRELEEAWPILRPAMEMLGYARSIRGADSQGDPSGGQSGGQCADVRGGVGEADL